MKITPGMRRAAERFARSSQRLADEKGITTTISSDGEEIARFEPGGQTMAAAETAGAEPAKGRGRKNGVHSDEDSVGKAIDAAKACVEEQWSRFQNAIHETLGDQAVSITVSLKYRPGKDSAKKSRPPQVRVECKANLPTLRRVFEARDSGGQLVLGYESEE